MKKQYIQPEIKLNLSELKATFMDDAVSWGTDGGHDTIVDDGTDPDEIFSKERKNEYSLW